jgi:hypothetical protein
METLDLEQEPLQPAPLKSKLVQLSEFTRSVDFGVQSELSSFNEVYKEFTLWSVTACKRTTIDSLTKDDGIFQTDQRVPNRIQAE